MVGDLVGDTGRLMMSEKTELYRHYNGEGLLLYVGISLSAINRFIQHKQISGWANQVTKIEIEVFDTREDALKAETLAINNENPVYNIQKKRREYKTFIEEKIEDAKIQLISRVVNYNVLYTDEQAADVLMIGRSAIRRWIDNKQLGGIIREKIHKTRYGDKPTKKYFVSGWQLIDFIENCQVDGKFPTVFIGENNEA